MFISTEPLDASMLPEVAYLSVFPGSICAAPADELYPGDTSVAGVPLLPAVVFDPVSAFRELESQLAVNIYEACDR